jgi:soluble lytic murein transglycosylase-like protein
MEQPCDPLPPAEIQPLIEQAAGAHKIPATLLNAVMERESAFRPCAVSPKGAQGLMQLMPATARELGVADPFDPRQNVDAGARLLQQLLTRYNGNLQLALSAYNAGAGRVDRAQGVPNIPETREYVLAIMKKLFY